MVAQACSRSVGVGVGARRRVPGAVRQQWVLDGAWPRSPMGASPAARRGTAATAATAATAPARTEASGLTRGVCRRRPPTSIRDGPPAPASPAQVTNNTGKLPRYPAKTHRSPEHARDPPSVHGSCPAIQPSPVYLASGYTSLSPSPSPTRTLCVPGRSLAPAPDHSHPTR